MLKSGILERFQKALPVIRELVNDLEWIENEFSPSKATEEERSQVKHLLGIRGHQFIESGWRLEEMFTTDVIAQGRLFKNKSERFQIEGTDKYFTCGSSCEVYLPYRDWEDENDLMTWVPTSIEYTHDKKRYYFTARPNVILDGALVRIRGRK